jgi:hypothetical protein
MLLTSTNTQVCYTRRDCVFQRWVHSSDAGCRQCLVRSCRSFVGSRFGSRCGGGARVLFIAAREHLHRICRVVLVSASPACGFPHTVTSSVVAEFMVTRFNCLLISTLRHPITHHRRYLELIDVRCAILTELHSMMPLVHACSLKSERACDQ